MKRHTTMTKPIILIAILASLTGGCEFVDGEFDEDEVGQTVDEIVVWNSLTHDELMKNGLTNDWTNAYYLRNYSLYELRYAFSTELNLSKTRKFMTYMVECALSSSQSTTFRRKKYYTKTSYYYVWDTYYGKAGYAPEWKNNDCDSECREKVTGCLLARSNWHGDEVAVSVRTWAQSVSSWEEDNYPYQEGAFYGDIFTGTNDDLYYCTEYNEFRHCDRANDPSCPVYWTGPCNDPNPNVDRRACAYRDSGGQYAVCATGDYLGDDPPRKNSEWYTYTVSAWRSSIW